MQIEKRVLIGKDTGEMTEVIFIWIVVVVSCVCTAVKSYLIIVCFCI